MPRLTPLLTLAALCMGLSLRAEAPDWTGQRLGFSFAAAMNTTQWTSEESNPDLATRTTHRLNALAGVQYGYSWLEGKHIVGWEFSQELGGLANKVSVGSSSYPVTRQDRVLGLSNLTMRWGLPKGDTLYFASAGVGMAYVTHHFAVSASPSDNFSATNHALGAVLGLGLERRIDTDWSWRAEWVHFEGGKTSFTRTDGDDFQMKARIDSVRVGLSCRF